jgi:hypothetical protein
VTAVGQNSVAVAKEEFNKWAKVTLSKGLSPGINGESERHTCVEASNIPQLIT